MTKRRVVSALMSALVVLAGILMTSSVAWAEQAKQAIKATRESFKIKVNYDLSLAGMIAVGKYSRVEDYYFLKNWSAVEIKRGQADVTVVLVRFLPPEGHPPNSGFREPSNMKWAQDPDNRSLHGFEVLRKLDAMGLEPANLPELLAFGAAYPNRQREFPIIALGSRAQATLGRDVVGRYLNLDHHGGYGYTIFCRFAAVRKPPITVSDGFKVRVNYDLSLEEMIAAGKYPQVIKGINSENFPIVGKGQADVDILLVHFGRYVDAGKVLPNLDRLGMRPANLPELLAFGATYPDKQREFAIVAMGAIGNDRYGHRSVMNLDMYDSERILRLDWIGYSWGDKYYFAAVRKSH